MLNIPDSVKTLFKQDGVHKNFHVHFPNGETTDLNNENIASESVQFTESLCSQQYFKFGLAEASQIEFTAVGIPNILGVYIECAIEIDCTSLGSTWAEENQVDDTLDWLEPQTCEYDSKIYYRVPYGKFKVDSCPRDHGAMWQRKITAYTEQVVSETEQVIRGQYSVSDYSLNPVAWLASREIEQEDMEAVGLNKKSTVPLWSVRLYKANGSGDGLSYLGGINPCEGSLYKYVVSISGNERRPLGYYLLSVDYEEHEFDSYGKALFDKALASLPSGAFLYTANNLSQSTIKYQKTFNSMAEAIAYRTGMFEPCFFVVIYYRKGTGSEREVYIRPSKPVFIKPKERYILDVKNFANFEFSCAPPSDSGFVFQEVLIYVNMPTEWRNTAEWVNEGGNSYQVNGWSSAAPFGDSQVVNREGEITVYFKYIENVSDNIPLASVKSTLSFKKGKALGTYYTYSNAISARKIIEGTMEMLGEFWKANRTGDSGRFRIIESQALIPVSRSNWQEFWWDENDVEPIGTVGVKMLVEENEEQEEQSDQLVQYSIGDGESIYLMEDNEILSNTTATVDEIQDFLNEYFAPNASVVNFTPVDLSMRGLPYLEAGDYIQLTAEDGTTVNTYILEQTISGIQHLTADVTSTNGELLEVIEE